MTIKKAPILTNARQMYVSVRTFYCYICSPTIQVVCIYNYIHLKVFIENQKLKSWSHSSQGDTVPRRSWLTWSWLTWSWLIRSWLIRSWLIWIFIIVQNPIIIKKAEENKWNKDENEIKTTSRNCSAFSITDFNSCKLGTSTGTI